MFLCIFCGRSDRNVIVVEQAPSHRSFEIVPFVDVVVIARGLVRHHPAERPVPHSSMDVVVIVGGLVAIFVNERQHPLQSILRVGCLAGCYAKRQPHFQRGFGLPHAAD